MLRTNFFHFALLLFIYDGVDGLCRFPHFLFPVPRGRRLTYVWTTEARYRGATSPVADTQLEVTVRDGNTLVTKLRHVGGVCAEQRSNVTCLHREFLYQRRCLERTDDNSKFFVEHNDGVSIHFLCMKFVQRGRNVVQVWLGRPGDSPDYSLCAERHLRREDWPWIASTINEWQFCPLVGGFDLHVFNSTSHRLQCENDSFMRPSRLESECVHGEGVRLTIHHPTCTPLPRDVTELHCWAGWTEGEWLFMLLARSNSAPQFVLRVAASLSSSPAISDSPAVLYSSPVCPVDSKPLDFVGVETTELLLTTSESGICYDETRRCRDVTRHQRCTKNSMYQYANVCKRSCGLCDLLPTTLPECRFSSDVVGEWLLAEVDGLEKVIVTTGMVSMSQLGEFVCKGKHWNVNYYKLLSYYNNGCRPRYSCLKLERHSDVTLQMQLSRSSLIDSSFDLCRFEDDPAPLGDRIHSARPKILLPWRKMESGTCGLHGTVHVSNIASSSTCQGSVSDWSSELCHGLSQLWLSLTGPCMSSSHAVNSSVHRRELNCVSYMRIAESFALLWTKDNSRRGGRRLSCWVIKSTGDGDVRRRRWTELYLLDRAQCGYDRDLDVVHLRSTAILSLTVTSDTVDKRCEATTVKPHRQLPAVRPHSGVRIESRPGDTYQLYSELDSSSNIHADIRLNAAVVSLVSFLCAHCNR